MSSNAIGSRLREARAQVAAARTALAEGRTLVLDGLVENIDAACRDLATASQPDATAFKSELITIFDDLNGLAEVLTREHSALKHALTDLSTRQRAQSAYGKSTRGGR